MLLYRDCAQTPNFSLRFKQWTRDRPFLNASYDTSNTIVVSPHQWQEPRDTQHPGKNRGHLLDYQCGLRRKRAWCSVLIFPVTKYVNNLYHSNASATFSSCGFTSGTKAIMLVAAMNLARTFPSRVNASDVTPLPTIPTIPTGFNMGLLVPLQFALQLESFNFAGVDRFGLARVDMMGSECRTRGRRGRMCDS